MQNSYRRFAKYIDNTLWIFASKITGIGLGFISIALVARHLGPEGFGNLAYALSVISIASVIGHLGLSGLVVRDLVESSGERNTILGTVAFLKIASTGLGYILITLIIGSIEGFQSIRFSLVAVAGLSLFLCPVEIINLWFEAFIQSKYTSYAQIVSQLSATVLRLVLVIGGFSLIYFSIVPVLQGLASAILLIRFYSISSEIGFSRWRIDSIKARELLSQGWIIFLGSLFAVIYLKVDQVMLGWLADSNEVGQYAVASQISEAFYFIPTAVVASFYPRLISLRRQDVSRFYRRLQHLFDGLFMLSLLAVGSVTLAFSHILPVIFGSAYLGSTPILVIHAWSGIFIFQRALFSKWILIEGLLVYSAITQGFGAAVNIILNFILIPEIGGVGAAYATLFSYATASFVTLFFYKRTRPIFWRMTLAFLSPVRYPFKLYRELAKRS